MSAGEGIEISVVIPAFRVAAYIRATVESILAQATDRLEVIVVNDGSPDTPELEAALEQVRPRIVYLKQPNRGVSSARNAGINAARGEWLAFLDGDDEWLPGYLDSQLAVLRSDPGIDMVFPNAVFFGETPLAGRTTVPQDRPFEEIDLLRALAGEAPIGYCAVLRRSRVIEAGMFDTSLHGSEDYNLWIRMLKKGARIVYQPKVLYKYRKRAGSATSDGVWMNDRILESFAAIERNVPLSDEERAALHRHRRKIALELAVTKGKIAFESRDFQSAQSHYAEANALAPSAKRRVLLFLLKFWPEAAYRFFAAREHPTIKAGPHAREHV